MCRDNSPCLCSLSLSPSLSLLCHPCSTRRQQLSLLLHGGCLKTMRMQAPHMHSQHQQQHQHQQQQQLQQGAYNVQDSRGEGRGTDKQISARKRKSLLSHNGERVAIIIILIACPSLYPLPILQQLVIVGSGCMSYAASLPRGVATHTELHLTRLHFYLFLVDFYFNYKQVAGGRAGRGRGDRQRGNGGVYNMN